MIMKRREFLLVTAAASAAAVSGHLPLLARTQERAKEAESVTPGSPRQTRNIFTQPPAIEPITGYLPSFHPVSDGSLNLAEYELTYKAIIWTGVNPETGKAQNRETGSLVLRRRQDGERARYTVDQKRQHSRLFNHLHAELVCSGSDDALTEWRITSSFLETRTGNEVSDLTLREQGTVRGNTIHVSDGRTNTEFRATGPVLSQWNVPGLLAKGSLRDRTFRFDLMHELSVFKPGQTFRYSGQVQIPVAKGDVNLHCYAQTGYGILPTHYLVDGTGRVQLITQSMLNWALQSVS
jgi:hypothetical protein